MLLVLTNQLAYWVVTRLSTASGLHAAEQSVAGGAGYTAYSYAYQLWVVPQGIITVSLVTALMPRMSRYAADGDLAGVRRDVAYALRTSAAAVVPAATALLVLAPWVIGSVFGYGRTTPADITVMAGIMMARIAERAGDVAAAGAGTLALLLGVVLLARPLGIGEITAMPASGRARLRR
ncbi:hypothetical protein GCM10010231_62860 [Streptomyces sindenensis]|nr:hypothetical protein GCM10010231_62860 [Streptomyces sindenensis]